MWCDCCVKSIHLEVNPVCPCTFFSLWGGSREEYDRAARWLSILLNTETLIITGSLLFLKFQHMELTHTTNTQVVELPVDAICRLAVNEYFEYVKSNVHCYICHVKLNSSVSNVEATALSKQNHIIWKTEGQITKRSIRIPPWENYNEDDYALWKQRRGGIHLID